MGVNLVLFSCTDKYFLHQLDNLKKLYELIKKANLENLRALVVISWQVVVCVQSSAVGEISIGHSKAESDVVISELSE